jgi:hypothetical protein
MLFILIYEGFAERKKKVNGDIYFKVVNFTLINNITENNNRNFILRYIKKIIFG